MSRDRMVLRDLVDSVDFHLMRPETRGISKEHLIAARKALAKPDPCAALADALHELEQEYLRLHGCFPLPQNKGYAAMSKARAALAAYEGAA